MAQARNKALILTSFGELTMFDPWRNTDHMDTDTALCVFRARVQQQIHGRYRFGMDGPVQYANAPADTGLDFYWSGVRPNLVASQMAEREIRGTVVLTAAGCLWPVGVDADDARYVAGFVERLGGIVEAEVADFIEGFEQ